MTGGAAACSCTYVVINHLVRFKSPLKIVEKDGRLMVGTMICHQTTGRVAKPIECIHVVTDCLICIVYLPTHTYIIYVHICIHIYMCNAHAALVFCCLNSLKWPSQNQFLRGGCADGSFHGQTEAQAPQQRMVLGRFDHDLTVLIWLVLWNFNFSIYWE